MNAILTVTVSPTARSRKTTAALRARHPDAYCVMEPEGWFTYGPRHGDTLVAVVDGEARVMTSPAAVRAARDPLSFQQWHEPDFFAIPEAA